MCGVYVRVCVHSCTCVCACVCAFMYMCLCMCVHASVCVVCVGPYECPISFIDMADSIILASSFKSVCVCMSAQPLVE